VQDAGYTKPGPAGLRVCASLFSPEQTMRKPIVKSAKILSGCLDRGMIQRPPVEVRQHSVGPLDGRLACVG